MSIAEIISRTCTMYTGIFFPIVNVTSASAGTVFLFAINITVPRRGIVMQAHSKAFEDNPHVFGTKWSSRSTITSRSSWVRAHNTILNHVIREEMRAIIGILLTTHTFAAITAHIEKSLEIKLKVKFF